MTNRNKFTHLARSEERLPLAAHVPAARERIRAATAPAGLETPPAFVLLGTAEHALEAAAQHSLMRRECAPGLAPAGRSVAIKRGARATPVHMRGVRVRMGQWRPRGTRCRPRGALQLHPCGRW